MFRPEISELQRFYRTPLGQLACRHLRRRIRAFWGEVGHEDILSIGYAFPYLRPWVTHCRSVTAATLALHGAVGWPAPYYSRSLVVSEAELPWRNESMDRVLVLHALEYSGYAGDLLQEIFRILTPEGKLLIVAPNRTGLWAQADHTPFGHGQPFTQLQIERGLVQNGFTIAASGQALYFPPSRRHGWLKLSGSIEKTGIFCGFPCGGVHLIEAAKHVPAPTRPGLAEPNLAFLRPFGARGVAAPSSFGR